MIRLEGVGKTYPDGTVAVHDLYLDVPRGDLVCLVGPSGCGKSTTLKMVNRLIEPTAARLLGWDARRARERGLELMELVGLDPDTFADRYPHQLSGGERQRVGVARALAADPPVLLMDEPFGAVDPVVRMHLQEEFLRLHRELHKTVLMVTHDIDEAVKMGDRVAVFAEGGRLAQYDVPATVLGAPADEFVTEFVGGSRGIRRLAVTPIDPDLLEPLDGVSTGELAGTVDVSASLEDAMALMMREDLPMIGVIDRARFLGVLTPNGVHAMLRASVRAG
jgi:osmoprotectant transport system ATP-binding protein